MSHAVSNVFGGGHGGGGPAPAPVPQDRGPDRSHGMADKMATRRSQMAAAAAEDDATITNNDADLLGSEKQLTPQRKNASARLLGG